MEKLLQEHLEYIKKLWFIINDEIKVLWYLRWVWYYNLKAYFNIFENKNVDFQEIINCYLFDKNLRVLNLSIIESIETFIKNLFILNFWNKYLDKDIYNDKIIKIKGEEKNIQNSRIEFINKKIETLSKKDLEIKNILKKYKTLNSEVFINKLTFGEIIRFIQDLNKQNKLIISKKIWIKLKLLLNWLDCLVYLRNICSHWENIFNKEMIKSVEWKDINKLFWIENNNSYISYFVIISIFKNILIPNYNWEGKVFDKMKQYNIKLDDFWQKKETFPNELESEAWKVLVRPLYEKYVNSQVFSLDLPCKYKIK